MRPSYLYYGNLEYDIGKTTKSCHRDQSVLKTFISHLMNLSTWANTQFWDLAQLWHHVAEMNPARRSVRPLWLGPFWVGPFWLWITLGPFQLRPFRSGAVLTREREIKFISLFGDRGHRSPYSPYKPCNYNLYIGIIISPHIDNTQSTVIINLRKKQLK